MNNDNNEIKGKQVYEKPMLRIIELATEEVMGVGCKGTTGTAVATPCVAINCFAVGS